MKAITITILLAALVSATGCRSMNQPSSARFASVTIDGRTPVEIRDAAVAVFKRDGYQVARAQPENMVFEKEGSRMNQLAYGTWLSEGVWVRVKAEVVPDGGSQRLQCQAYMVKDYGSGMFEEEQRLVPARGRPFQKLLDQVASQLKPSTTTNP